MLAASYGADGTRRAIDATALQQSTEVLDPLGLKDFLLKLPGVTEHNIRGLLGIVRCIADVARLTVQQLTPALGPASARVLHKFLHQGV